MPAKTNYLLNKVIDLFWRGQTQTHCGLTFTVSGTGTIYLALLNHAQRVNSAAVSLNTFIVLADSSGVQHLLKCTTAGTTAAAPPSVAITNNGTVTDGTVTWTDQYAALKGNVLGNLPTEFSGGSYARSSNALTLANFAGTQGAGTTTASTGTSGVTSNNATQTFTNVPAGACGVFLWMDAASAGNIIEYGFVTGGTQPIASGATVTFAAGALTIQEDS